MNQFFKISLLGIVMFVSSCGVYYDPFYSEGWIVEEEIIVAEPVGHFVHERLTFQIKWNQSSYNPDLITTLLTPYAALIEDGGPEMDAAIFWERMKNPTIKWSA
jgi:hypothetical protein